MSIAAPPFLAEILKEIMDVCTCHCPPRFTKRFLFGKEEKNALLSGQRSVLSRRLNKDQNQQQLRETFHNTMKHKLMITRKDLSSDVMSLRPCRSSIRCTCPKFFMKSDPAPSTRARDSSLFRLAEASYSCNYFQVIIRKWTKSPNI